MSLDGVIDAPTWTFDYGFHPKMGEAIGAVGHGAQSGHPARAHDLRDVRAGVVGAPWRTIRGRRSSTATKYVVSGTLTTATWRNSEIIGPYDPCDPKPEGRGGRPLRQRQRQAGAGDARRRPGRRAASFVYPLTQGAARGSSPRARRPPLFSLAACESYENGVVHLAYRPQTLRSPPTR